MASLTGSLTRGALLSPFKRPRPDADYPRAPLTLARTRIDLARLAAYERACGFPTGADALPPTYPHILGFPLAMRLMSGRDFPLPLLGLVHTSLDLTRYATLPATGAYDVTVRVGGLTPHRRGTEATVVTELRPAGEAGDFGDAEDFGDTGEAGEVVWESRSTYLARHRTGRPAGTAGAPPDTPLPELTEWHLAGDLGRRYAAASGDRNPIHLHPLTARVFGFPRPIAHGMWSVARCLAEHGTPDAVRVRARFLAPVPLPGTVRYGARDGRFELRGGERVHLTGSVEPLASPLRR
ncbi:MaoC/PaaZ C-terminal domain-containing protein [Streptomyces sp. NPDC052610]|uniref:MaoC/PaaZ C-terminal domain-containing protein n=1 Tax=Streptomyces sp. NPDC052610 TaxID=3154952 RepID=UPI003440C1F8